MEFARISGVRHFFPLLSCPFFHAAIWYTDTMNTMHSNKQLHIPEEIDLESTLFSGQCFSWYRREGGYLACIEQTAAYLNTESRTLFWEGALDAAYWTRYFDMARDYQNVFLPFKDDAFIQKAYAQYGGMRILNQPVWETLCAFIISANNNIKRITNIMTYLRAQLGTPLSIQGQTVSAFPDAAAIIRAGEHSLRELGLGYRAAYLYETARRVESGFDLTALPRMGYAAALKALVDLPGVGEKVADCVLLFSCGYSRAFPVDVWVKRVMRVMYGASGSNAAIKAKGYACFGEDAGIVQQILFHAARMGLFPALDENSAAPPNIQPPLSL